MYAGIYGGVSRSFGVYFLQYQERFKALAAEVAVMSLIENITSSLMGNKYKNLVNSSKIVDLDHRKYTMYYL